MQQGLSLEKAAAEFVSTYNGIIAQIISEKLLLIEKISKLEEQIADLKFQLGEKNKELMDKR